MEPRDGRAPPVRGTHRPAGAVVEWHAAHCSRCRRPRQVHRGSRLFASAGRASAPAREVAGFLTTSPHLRGRECPCGSGGRSDTPVSRRPLVPGCVRSPVGPCRCRTLPTRATSDSASHAPTCSPHPSAHRVRRAAPQRAAPERNRKRDGEVSVPLSESINSITSKGSYGSRQSAGDSVGDSCRAVGVPRRPARRDPRPLPLPPLRDLPCRTPRGRPPGQRRDRENRAPFSTGRSTPARPAQLPYFTDWFATRRHPSAARTSAGLTLRASIVHPHAGREGRFRRC